MVKRKLKQIKEDTDAEFEIVINNLKQCHNAMEKNLSEAEVLCQQTDVNFDEHLKKMESSAVEYKQM